MNRLRSRQNQIPNGMFFRIPEISWDSRKVLSWHPSFDTLVRAVISARKANPHHAAKHKWAMDFDTVANEVEQFQVKVCIAAGWTKYITDVGGGAPLPLAQSRSPQEQNLLDAAASLAHKIFDGVKAIQAWQADGAVAVNKELAESRAAVCVECPLNGQGDFSKWFTKPAAAAIARQVEWLTGQNLRTSQDDKLNICEACLCAMKLKVHLPIKYIKMGLTPAVIEELRKGKDCWKVKESEAVQT